jgi:hypothetical protein
MRHRVNHGDGLYFSDELRELGRRIEEADGIEPLRPGVVRPPGYYMAGFWTRGRKPIDMSKPAPPPDADDER